MAATNTAQDPTSESVPEPLLYDRAALQPRLLLGATKINELFQSGELPTVVIGRRRYVTRDDLYAFIERLQERARADRVHPKRGAEQ